jgi:hypothetical protein
MITRPRIRPLGLGDLLDESFRLYRRYFVNFVAIAALALVPYTLLSLLVQLPLQSQIETFQQQAASGADPFAGGSVWDFFGGLAFGVLGSVGIGLLYTIFVQPLLEGALARGISQGYLDRPVSLGDSFGAALRHSLGLIGARLIPALLSGLGLALILGISVGSIALLAGVNPARADDSAAFSQIGSALALVFCMFGLIVVFGIAALLLFVRLLFSSQAVVVEGRGPVAAIKRSWELTRGYYWRTLGYLLVIGLLVFLIGSLPATLITLPIQFVAPDQLQLQTVINTVVGAILNIIVMPFGLIAYTLMYYDLRIRKEGFDLEQQTTLLGLPQTGAAPLELR